ncbi:helix-turn-helix domain-containing protein [Terrilactibacillus sp. S3-3]|nr:helix-turn-helix domain-containing protein [Terrilactibacillus sp. S3-3]
MRALKNHKNLLVFSILPLFVRTFNKTIGCSRFVFNFFLGKQKEKDA